MISYLDRAFCKYYQECHVGEGCKRALTPEITKEAIKEKLPISQFADRPPCFVVKRDLTLFDPITKQEVPL